MVSIDQHNILVIKPHPVLVHAPIAVKIKSVTGDLIGIDPVRLRLRRMILPITVIRINYTNTKL